MVRENAALINGGGATIENSTNVIFDNCTIHNNSSYEGGGGIYITNNSAVQINTCKVQNNTVFFGSRGGGGIMILDHSSLFIYASTITGNQMNPWFSIGGGVFIRDQSNARFDHSILAHNYSHIGTEIGSRSQSSVHIRNCVLYGTNRYFTIGIDCTERATEYSPIQVPSNASLENSISWNHNIESLQTFPSIMNSVIGANSSSTILNSASFGFMDPDHGDFRLQPHSPLIDAGEGTLPHAAKSPIDGDKDGIAVWDIGAIEYDPISLQ